MYTLLIADDERAIREGIANSICWEEIDIGRVLLAKNGQEAYDTIIKDKPDIVLTDIIMPMFTGIELIEKVKEEIPQIQFIILSGYSDFCYAQKAIENGVKQYILKPCDADDIKKTIQEAVLSIKNMEDEEAFIQSMKDNVDKLLPQAKEQFFRDFIKGEHQNTNLIIYKDLFQLKEVLYRMLLFKVGDEQDYLKLFTVKKLIENKFKAENVCFCIITNASLVLLTDIVDFNKLFELVETIQRHCYLSFDIDVTVAVSNEGMIKSAAKMYREVKEIIKFEFYLGEGKIITRNDIDLFEVNDDYQINMQTEELSDAIRSGNVSLVEDILDEIFNSFRKSCHNINKVRTAGIELYVAVIRECEEDENGSLIKNIVEINECNTISDIQQFIMTTAVKLAKSRYELVTSNHNKVIEKVIKYVHQNIDDENLSLQLIASKNLYLNVDYLGKLFKKETGIRFSQYLTQIRMEKAKELISNNTNDFKIYEIAEATGFANNPSYFSQLFKKHTGILPKDFKCRTRSFG